MNLRSLLRNRFSSWLLLLWRGYAFALRLLLPYWTCRTLSLWLRLRSFPLPLLLLDATCFTLLLTATPLLSRLLLLNLNRRLCLWRAATFALVSHLELLSFRAI